MLPTALAADDLKPYPAPEAGYQRFVIRLPDVAHPEKHKVELLLGKQMEVDCNRHNIGGQLVSKIAQGWGYPYLLLEKLGPTISTRMACPPEEGKRRKLVSIHSQPNDLTWQDYTPKLPIVIFVPEGVEVSYRIWSGGLELLPAEIQ